MPKRFDGFLLLLVLTAGCASRPWKFVDGDSALATTTAQEASEITLANYEQPATTELPQPPVSDNNSAVHEHETTILEPLPHAGELTLEALEEMALASNPAIAQAAARVRALRGKWVQVGLPPNPTGGYSAGEVGNDGAGGQQGGYFGQQIITAKKLRRNRAIVAAEITRAEQQLAATQQRVLTDVRGSYYSALLAQRRVEVADKLVRFANEAVDASQALLNAEEIPLAGLLQTEVRQQNAKVFLQTAHNSRDQAWRQLSSVVGGPELPIQPLAGDVRQLPELLNWNEQLTRVQITSPEVSAAMAEVERARRALSRARVEPIPNINTQFSVQYDNASGYTIAGIQAGMPIPIWNRNQGGIRQAQAEVAQAMRNVDRVERDLQQRLAEAFRQYASAHVTAENYAREVLPRSQRTFELVQQGYAQGEVGYLDLLTAQQTYSQTNLAYLDALGELWRSYVQIDGLLLSNSLSEAE